MLHKDITSVDNHIPYSWQVADATERGALSLVAGDVGKLCWQTNTDTFWFLKNLTPTWIQFGGASTLAGLADWPAGVSATEVGYLDGVTSAIQTQLGGKISSSEKGAASGVAPLDAGGKVDASYLPSYVDDVLEYANLAAFPATGTAGIIYVAIDTNYTYRWSGSAYVQIGGGVGGAITIKDEGSNLTTALASIDFVGAGVVATTSGNNVTVTIAGGGGAATVGMESIFLMMGG